MAVENRISVSFNDQEYLILERLSAHTHMTKAALIRSIVEEFLRDNPDRFRRKTKIGLKRPKNIVLSQKKDPSEPGES
jgi:predicted DNA-binding protein